MLLRCYSSAGAHCLRRLFILFCIVFCSLQQAYGALRSLDQVFDSQQVKTDPKAALPRYLLNENKFTFTKKDSERDNKSGGILVEKYLLVSQEWKIPEGSKVSVNHPKWEHRVTIYKPKVLQGDTALLYINGGTLHPIGEKPIDDISDDLQFKRIANKTKSIVIDLRDVPNQYLKFTDLPIPLQEDDLISYTWEHYLKENNEDWILQLLMTKSAVKAMDMVQSIDSYSNVKKFVVCGTSKRGWAAWLTAAMDDRVVGLISLVMDIMHLEKSVPYLFKVYPAGSVVTLRYKGLIKNLSSEHINTLFFITDPFSYLKLLTIPKLLVSATGDNFFPPDLKRFYYHDLLGEKAIRVIPNSDHYICRKSVQRGIQSISNSVLTYYELFKSKGEVQSIPKMTWEYIDNKFTITSEEKPKWARFWWAKNKLARDFRKVEGNLKGAFFSTKGIELKHKKNDTTGLYIAQMNITPPKKGWLAWFVEVGFNNKRVGFPDLVQTTEVIIIPDKYPVQSQPKHPKNTKQKTKNTNGK